MMSPFEAEGLVAEQVEALLSTFNVEVHRDPRRQIEGNSVLVAWERTDFEPRQIREEPRQGPTPATQSVNRISIYLYEADADEEVLSNKAKAILPLPSRLSGEYSDQRWYWVSMEKPEYDLTEDFTPRALLLMLGYDEMILE